MEHLRGRCADGGKVRMCPSRGGSAHSDPGRMADIDEGNGRTGKRGRKWGEGGGGDPGTMWGTWDDWGPSRGRPAKTHTRVPSLAPGPRCNTHFEGPRGVCQSPASPTPPAPPEHPLNPRVDGRGARTCRVSFSLTAAMWLFLSAESSIALCSAFLLHFSLRSSANFSLNAAPRDVPPSPSQRRCRSACAGGRGAQRAGERTCGGCGAVPVQQRSVCRPHAPLRRVWACHPVYAPPCTPKGGGGAVPCAPNATWLHRPAPLSGGTITDRPSFSILSDAQGAAGDRATRGRGCAVPKPRGPRQGRCLAPPPGGGGGVWGPQGSDLTPPTHPLRERSLGWCALRAPPLTWTVTPPLG